MKHRPTFTVTCQCGKRSFLTRADARHVARMAHPGDKLSAYRCEVSGAYHIGHLHPGVVKGVLAR